jgi:hypothetical protein
MKNKLKFLVALIFMIVSCVGCNKSNEPPLKPIETPGAYYRLNLKTDSLQEFVDWRFDPDHLLYVKGGRGADFGIRPFDLATLDLHSGEIKYFGVPDPENMIISSAAKQGKDGRVAYAKTGARRTVKPE